MATICAGPNPSLPYPVRRFASSNQGVEMAKAEKIIVYEKPTCTTCRQLARILREAGVEYEAVDYIVDPISRDELTRLLELMGMAPRELLRRRAKRYREQIGRASCRGR